MGEGASALGLYWLPENPGWSREAAALDQAVAEERTWRKLVELANARFDLIRTIRLDRLLQKLFGDNPPSHLSTRPVRLAVLGSSVTTHLLPGIRVAGLRRDLWVKTYEPGFNQYYAELNESGSGLDDFEPNAILFAFDAHHCIREMRSDAGRGDADAALDALIAHLHDCCSKARDRYGCHILVQTPLPILPGLLGNNEHRLPGSYQRFIEKFSEKLRDFVEAEGIDLVAVDARAAWDGVRNWHDPALWRRAKQEISPAVAPIYGDLVARVLAARQGRSRKCLVLDLDNTLWGGVVGDDGVGGLVLGQGSAAGESFLALQGYARDLARPGIILAVCSKNDEANAVAAFDKHPEMLLKRTDVASFMVNWNDKASNIQTISREINIGLDSLVFVDDNPVERDFVRSVLPMVAVPEIPIDPALVPQCLMDAGYFEATIITNDDLQRTEQYRANRERAQQAAAAPDLQTYLLGLKMQLIWGRFDAENQQRIVQLINKTNQFNLMTKRCTEEEILRFGADPDCLGLHFRLVDNSATMALSPS
jgi:FkbH-like protein